MPRRRDMSPERLRFQRRRIVDLPLPGDEDTLIAARTTQAIARDDRLTIAELLVANCTYRASIFALYDPCCPCQICRDRWED